MSNQPALTLFPPSEVARITGLSTLAQSDWRRRGYLPPLPSTAHARFDVFDLARVSVMMALAERGIGPARSKALAPSCAARIVSYALAWPNAWSGNPGAAPGAIWGAKSVWLRAGMGFDPREYRFMMWGFFEPGEETHCFVSNPMDWFDGVDGRHRIQPGPVVVCDLEAMGGKLLDLAGRPLAHVELPA